MAAKMGIDDTSSHLVDAETNREEQPSTSSAVVDVASDSDSNKSDSDEDDLVTGGYVGSSKKGRRRGVCRRRGASKLDPHYRGLLGEANLRYARGDLEVAKRMCFTLIERFPEAYEPYITLSQIYKNTDKSTYKGVLIMASSINPNDPAVWCRLAELEVEEGELKKAVTSYSKAIKADKRDITLHTKRLKLVEELGDVRFTLACKKQLAKNMPRSQFQTIIELCKEVTKKYHEEKNYAKALEVLDIPFKRIPKKVTQDLVNMMLELLLLTERYMDCLDIFIQHCNFSFEIEVPSENTIVINSYAMPPATQIDLKVKFIVCVVKLKSLHLVPPLIAAMICEENVEEIGDLFLDVAEELMTAGLQHEALKLLVPLVKSKTYNLAAVWLKYAECLHNCDLLEQAVEAYFMVMTMAPQHVEVLYPLAMTLLKLNKKSEALDVLSQDLSTNKIDVAVLIERMKLLRQIGDLEEYWRCAEVLLSRHSLVLKYPEEIKIILTGQSFREKVKRIRALRNFRRDQSSPETEYESIREPSADVEYKLYKGILDFALEQKQYHQLQKLTFMGLVSKKFHSKYAEIFIWAFLACIHNNDTFYGYSLIRDIVVHEQKNPLAWNLFNVLLQNADDVRHHRFITRFQTRLPGINTLQVFEANYGLTVNAYNLCLKFYMSEFRKNRSPYLAFMLGMILLQIYSKKKNSFDDKKKLSEIVPCLFLFYGNSRSKDASHEVLYNLGRMYQQLGVQYLAEHYYLRVLEIDEEKMEHADVLGLKHEAAFNLHLIYKNSGNMVAARNILIKHLVI